LPANPYNDIRYPTWPRLETHPDRLAAVATLYGMNPAPVDRCRVLELGASDGGNLIPMAYALPGSRFVGVDLARKPVAEGNRAIRELKLRNIHLLRADVCKLPADLGEFDYVIAHGLYSWVPAAARDAILAVCRERLAPGGVAFVSYNAYPGRHIRQMLREMMLFHTAGRPNVDEAQQFLAFLRSAAMLSEPWRALLEAEIESVLERDTAGLFHDDLAAENHPVYFHEFVTHARRHGLQYLGDAHVHESLDHRGSLRALGNDRIAREQYLDFLKLRRFRQTLLCRQEERIAKEPLVRRLSRLYYSSPARAEGDYLVGANRVRIRANDPDVAAVAETLACAWPRPVAFAELGNREIVNSLCRAGFVEPHAWSFPAAAAIGETPAASAVARREARLSPYVTNLCHRTVFLEPAMAALLPLVDGTRTVPALAKDWAREKHGPTQRGARENVRQSLDWMAQMALLIE
jgi:SAM-dependent methyltransferase